VRGHRLLLICGVCALLLTPSAGGGPNVPGDPTPPVVTPHIFGTLGLNGWYVSNVTVNWTVEDPESVILETRGCDAVTLTSDTVGAPLSCYARSDGGETTVAITIRLDKTGPVVTATPSRSPDSNGWYNHSLSVSFSGTDATSGIDSCDPPQGYSGPDSGSATVSGTCRDRAGNSTQRTLGLSYDATAPQVTGATPSRGTDRNGWYNHTLSVAFSGTDATSAIDTCTQTSYSGPDSANASVSGTCRDRAGNTSASSSFNFQYDETGPVVTATPSRSPDANGWYNHALTVSFNGTDATSGIDTCTSPQSYSGPDNANASVSGSCVDRAGNSTQRTFGLSYDSTAPQVTGSSPSRNPDSNGWYNHAFTITFAGTDGTSGIESCTQTTYSGPDDATGAVSGTCRDRAGNTSATSNFNFQYDSTGPVVTATPSRAPDSNGWYNHALTVGFAGTDGTSGMGSCVAPQGYSGPDNANASVSGSCTDRAGNTTLRSLGLSYDATLAQVTGATPSRGTDHNGWYNHTLSIAFNGSDATSGIDTCTQTSYSGPDSANASVSGTCRDRAGNTSTAGAFNFQYDETAPSVTATPSRNPDSNGWYNHALTVSFAGTDPVSGIESCVPPQSYSGPDNANASVSGSCVDRAGNSTARTFGLSYDGTAPTVTATPSRNPDSNGWYNHVLTVSFAGTDAISGIDSCVSPQSYSGPDSANATVSGSCRDRAGNTTVRAFGLSYDATGPVVTATPGRAPDSNGWYNHSLTVTFAGTDATSGVESCVAPQTYSGPDDPTGSVNGSCRDRAGNTTNQAFGLAYDQTGPIVTATPSRAPDSNGWYNHALTVSFTGTDGTSGMDTCVGPLSYSGPDSANASLSGSCRDRAGNTTLRGFGLSYDATAALVTGASASRPSDRNGWYNHALTITFAGTDATSGIDSCAQTSFTGPDSANASVSGTCRDRAGNSSAATSFNFQYDGTGPVVTATPSRAPDSNGWYNHALTVSYAGTDATSGIDSCVPPQSYSGPDNANGSVNGSCADRAGNTGLRAFGLSYDGTAPHAFGAPARQPDSNGWYNQPIRVAFEGTDATSGINSCTAPLVYSGPDDPAASMSGDCADRAGNVSAAETFSLGYDATAPQVTAAPRRAPDANGWYNHLLTVDFSGVDATSGVESCTQANYSGPDSASAFVGGSCRDRAGNQGTASAAIKYDGTAPTVMLLVPKPGKRTAELIWRTTPDAQSVELLRSPGPNGEAEGVVFRGASSVTSYLDTGLRPGRTYRYRLATTDEAANVGTKTLDFVARGALLFPAPGEKVNKPPLLVWAAARGASYYNVVLTRGRRVYSAWPVRARLQLARSWKYHGRRYKLRPGTYRWYVWPGRGRLSAGRYGKLLGASSFVVTR
jgi:large repetitive protein